MPVPRRVPWEMGIIDRDTAREAWRIAWPLMLADSIESILWLTDTYFVSGLGDEAVAALGLGGYLSWFFFSISTLIVTGVLVLASQHLGARDPRGASRVAGEGVGLALGLGIPIALLAWTVSPLLVDVLGGDVGPEVERLATDYFRYRMLFVPASYAAFTMDSVYRASGVTKPVLVGNTSAAALNVVLDPLLIYGYGPFPALGITGAALASGASMVTGFILLYAMHPLTGLRFLPYPPTRVGARIIRVGLPAMVERLVFVGGNAAYIGVVARCGEQALAAHTIGIRVESIAFLPLFSLSTASSAMVGSRVGAGDMDGAKKVGWEVTKLAAILGALVAAVIVVASPVVPKMFTDDPHVAWLAMIYLIIAAITEPALGVVMNMAASIRGAGDTTTPTIVNLTLLYLLRVLPAPLLASMAPLGVCVLGAWLAMGLDVSGRAIVFSILYRRRFHRMARRLVEPV